MQNHLATPQHPTFFEENQLIRQRGGDCAETAGMVVFFCCQFFLLTPLRSLLAVCARVSLCVWLITTRILN
jgi:hypothetical protein